MLKADYNLSILILNTDNRNKVLVAERFLLVTSVVKI